MSDDTKQRFGLAFEKAEGTILAYTAVERGDGENGTWLIKANQGHSLKVGFLLLCFHEDLTNYG